MSLGSEGVRSELSRAQKWESLVLGEHATHESKLVAQTASARVACHIRRL